MWNPKIGVSNPNVGSATKKLTVHGCLYHLRNGNGVPQIPVNSSLPGCAFRIQAESDSSHVTLLLCSAPTP